MIEAEAEPPSKWLPVASGLMLAVGYLPAPLLPFNLVAFVPLLAWLDAGAAKIVPRASRVARLWCFICLGNLVAGTSLSARIRLRTILTIIAIANHSHLSSGKQRSPSRCLPYRWKSTGAVMPH